MERSRFAGCRCIAARGRHITLTLDRSDARRGSAYRIALDGNDVHATPAPTVIESSAARIDEASDPSVSPVRPASAMALRRSRSSGTSRAACWRESNQRAAPVRVCPRWCGDRSTSRSSGSQLPILQRSIWPAFACNGETSLAEPLPSICRSFFSRALSPIGCRPMLSGIFPTPSVGHSKASTFRTQSLTGKRAGLACRIGGVSNLAPSWFANGMAIPSASRHWKRASPGKARPIEASQWSPERLQAVTGMGRGSSASLDPKRWWARLRRSHPLTRPRRRASTDGEGPPHEATTRRTIVVCKPVEAMRGLHAGFDRPRARARLQFPGRPARSL
jgi:hypothetical protein